MSFSRYDLTGCAIFAALPFAAARLGGCGVRRMFKAAGAALPFVLCAGIANCFFDRAAIVFPLGITLSGGLVSLLVLVLKAMAAAGIALLLAGSTPMAEIADALRRLHLPCILILQLQMLFRYLDVTVDEARKMTEAYFLRAPGRKTIPVRDWGKLAGSLFLRSASRARRIYSAMQCRLFHAGKARNSTRANECAGDWAGVFFLTVILMLTRWYL